MIDDISIVLSSLSIVAELLGVSKCKNNGLLHVIIDLINLVSDQLKDKIL